MPNRVRTTTIQITKPQSLAALTTQYQLVRYILPRSIAVREDNTKYGRIHNSLKEALDHPYKLFTHDADGWVVYVLYPASETPISTLRVLDETASAETFEFAALMDDSQRYHVLIKLLQVTYFYAQGEAHFVAQDTCYLYVERRRDQHICLKLELKGDQQVHTQFRVNTEANTFGLVSERDREFAYKEAFFQETSTQDGQTILRQVKRSQIQPDERYYIHKAWSDRRTTVDYHDLKDIFNSRAYLIYDFVQGFKTHLEQFGFGVEFICRNFEEFRPSTVAERSLALEKLGKVYVCDVRFNREQNPLARYLDVMCQSYQDIAFEPVPREQLSTITESGVLFLQDVEPDAFTEGALHGKTDPYGVIYKEFPHLPKQFVSVNGNSIYAERSRTPLTRERYLGYEFTFENDESQRAIQVALTQLYLKQIAMRELPVREHLPLAPVDYVFVRKATFGGTSYTTALAFQNGIATFWDLRAPEGKASFYELVEDTWQVRYDEQIERLVEYRRRDSEEKLSAYDLILATGVFVSIEDLDERVLYEFDEIEKRFGDRKKHYSIADLLLLPKYDDVRTSTMHTLDKMRRRELITDNPPPLRTPENSADQESLELYQQLQQYDEFLQSLDVPSISYNTLTERYREDIARIFVKGGKQDLLRYYQRTGKFLSTKAVGLIPTYKGIWHDADLRYVVGDVNSFNQSQARAHLIRQFMVWQGKQVFDPRPMLDAMTVQFVRHKQYTVYPYYFHLIDIYVENVLRHLPNSE